MAISKEFLEQLKGYTRAKKKLAAQLSVSEKTIQQMVDVIISASISSGGRITEAQCLDLVRDEASAAHNVFNWSKVEEQLLEEAGIILDSIGIAFSSDNKVFKITKST